MTTHDQDVTKTARVLLIVDQPVLARVIALALVHGPYQTHIAVTLVREMLGRQRSETAEPLNGREESRKRQLSEAARKRIAAAQKRRWAEYRKQQSHE